ncbi:MAG: c-type cytochrome [Sedimenticola sp.]|nr:c-type cytochrome [Sedimenticola sp.]
MSHKVVSQFKSLAVAGISALLVSLSVQAQERAEVLERIKPVGEVSVAGEEAAAAAPAVADSAAAAPADPGAALYQAKGCTACHGPEGKTPIMSTYPKVASLPEQYILNQLKDIKSGAREHGQTAVMKGIMAAVSEEDMKVLAAWLSGIPRGAAAPAPAAAAPAAAAPAAEAQAAPAAAADPGKALYTQKGCAACHGPEGRTPIMSTYPKVTGMPEQYIANQMKDIKSGARSNGQSAVMKGIMAAVSEEDIKTIAGWLSQQPR